MMNKIDSFFDKLDKKNLFLLYFSLFIGAFVLYYNINISLKEQIEENEIKISKMHSKLKELSSYASKIEIYKKMLKTLQKENFALQEDLKYLNLLISTSSILHLSQKQFLNILEEILSNAIDYNMKASYKITMSSNDLLSYNIEINGEFNVNEYKNFYSFLRSLDKIKKIKSVSFVTLEVKEDKVLFKIILSFWSLI